MTRSWPSSTRTRLAVVCTAGTTTTAPANFAVDSFGRIVDANQVNPSSTGYNGASIALNAHQPSTSAQWASRL